MDAIILCGGLGTRLASVVNNVPKPLAPVGGKPFLNFILDSLVNFPIIKRVILATGHLSEKIQENYGLNYCRLPINYSQEMSPLGTGGAVLNVLKNFELSRNFFILNGDSYSDLDLNEMLLMAKKYENRMIISGVALENSNRYGALEIVGNSIISFREKDKNDRSGFINSGVYIANKEVFSRWNNGYINNYLSMENDIFPILVKEELLKVYKYNGKFIDIGLPDTFKEAPDFFQNLNYNN